MAQVDLHAEALKAEDALEQLATGLAKAGVDEKVVDLLTNAAKVARAVAAQLGKGQERTGDEEAPDEEAPAPEEESARPTMQSATNDLHRDTQASAARRRGY